MQPKKKNKENKLNKYFLKKNQAKSRMEGKEVVAWACESDRIASQLHTL